MTKLFSYALERGWAGAGDPLLEFAPDDKALLFSGGSLTVALERLMASPITAEVKFKARRPVGMDAAFVLGCPAEATATHRVVWLVSDKTRLVFAHTIIPIVGADAALMNELEALEQEPIGTVLSKKNITLVKEKIVVAVVTCQEAALDLSLDEKAAFVARRYLLKGRAGARILLNAVVTEIFSPALVKVKANGAVSI
ncbi:MAG: DUF98 domain-containing protein [Deltaproteobacteria bacterium]|nr:DUF98 domain-containing protein [Deltaproteobacteria bacterium]